MFVWLLSDGSMMLGLHPPVDDPTVLCGPLFHALSHARCAQLEIFLFNCFYVIFAVAVRNVRNRK